MAIKKKPELTWQQKLCKKFGITEQIRNSVGFNPKTKTWYGWSHRAIAGFKIGSTVKKGDILAGPKFKIGYKATTLADAKKMAETFSDYVS